MYRSSKIRRQHIIWQLIIFPRTDAGDSRQRQGLLSSPQQIPRSPAPARFMPIITVPAERPPVALRRMCVDDAHAAGPGVRPRGHALQHRRQAGHRGAPPRTAGLAARGARQARPLGRGRRRRGRLGQPDAIARHRPHPARLPAATARLGPGCATAAGRQLCDYAWRMLDVAALSAVAWPDNPPAARARKLGFVQAGTETHYGRDTVAYLLPRPASA